MNPPETLAQWFHWASAQLVKHSDSAQLDAELMLRDVLQKDRSYLRTWPEKQLSNTQHQQLQSLLDRRLQGEPMAYILGHQDFWTLSLRVSPAVLIPRPETELIIETALELLSPQQALQLADLGTGSGAIALALASEFSNSHVIAGDFSAAALQIAEQNRQQLQLHNCETRLGSWFDIFSPTEQFDLIVSNPPYIAEGDPDLQANVQRYEPQSALTANNNGLADLQHLIAHAPTFLKPGGWLILEHGWQQAEALRQQLQQQGFLHSQSHRDLAGHERITLGQQP